MFPALSCLASVSGLWHGKNALSHWTRRLWPWHGAGGGPSTSDQTDPHSPFSTIEPRDSDPSRPSIHCAGRTVSVTGVCTGRGAYTSWKSTIHPFTLDAFKVSAGSASDFKRQESFTLLSAVMLTFTSSTVKACSTLHSLLLLCYSKNCHSAVRVILFHSLLTDTTLHLTATILYRNATNVTFNGYCYIYCNCYNIIFNRYDIIFTCYKHCI